MDKIAKSSGSDRKFLFSDMVSKQDLEKCFDTIKHDDAIYFVIAHDGESGSFFVGGDLTIRFFVDLGHADKYRDIVQGKMTQYKFFVVKFHAVNGIARAIADAQSSPTVKMIAASTFQKDVLVDIDLVYKLKQLLN